MKRFLQNETKNEQKSPNNNKPKYNFLNNILVNFLQKKTNKRKKLKLKCNKFFPYGKNIYILDKKKQARNDVKCCH